MNQEDLKTVLKDDRDEVLIENNAQTIFDHLASLEKERELHEKRWFWELLQNAKDAVETDEQVKVRVELEGSKLYFKHSGNPFARKDILHLIFHGSSKKNAEGKTGRFGTGFMTTNLLAMQVNITGRLKEGYFFKFDLNRNASSPEQQHILLNLSFEEFEKSLQTTPYSLDEFETIFEFDLVEPGLNTAKEGIKQLSTILPVVLAFNAKITEIAVKDNGDHYTIENTQRQFPEQLVGKLNLNIREYRTGQDEVLQVYVFQGSESDIAVILKEEDGKNRILDLADQYPKLFYDFPLFGSEKIGFPVIINSKLFDPRTERDGIYLGKEEKSEILQNKRIITEALANTLDIIAYASDQHFADMHLLFTYQNPDNFQWLFPDWITDLYQQQITKLLGNPFIQLSPKIDGVMDGTKIPLSQLKLPSCRSRDTESFHGLLAQLAPDKTPSLSSAMAWLEVIRLYQVIQSIPLESYSCVINEDKVAAELDTISTLDQLKIQLDPAATEQQIAIDWLVSFYKLIDKEDLRTLCYRYKILPNEEGAFVIRTQTAPYVDEIGNLDLKEVAINHNWEIKKELLHPAFKWGTEEYQVMNISKVIQHLDQLIAAYTAEDLNIKTVRTAIIQQLKWLISCRQDQYLEDMTVLLLVERHSNTTFNGYHKRKLSGEDKLISPYAYWKTEYGIYQSIVRERLLLCDEYDELLSEADYSYLAEKHLIYLKPLIRVKRRASKNDLRLLARNPKDLAYLQAIPEGQDITIEFTDIPHLSGDDNILSKTKVSIAAAKQLLRFLFLEVLPTDPFAETDQPVIINGSMMNLSQQMWIGRLRNNQWVPVSSENEESASNESASAKNLTPLLSGETETLSKMNTRRSAIFLNKLGISIADIRRNTIQSEDLKLMWDLTFSSLLTNPNIDPELAIEMLSDHNLQHEYTKRKLERETIARNQQIGYLFEELFEKLLQKDEYKDKGLKITRRARGSDYDIVTDMDFVDEDKKEITLQAGNMIIELKASGKDVAEMTTRQVEDAVAFQHNYTLVVLPLNNYCIDEENIIEHARFVTNIGEILDPNLTNYNDYLQKKTVAQTDMEKVKVAIYDSKVRYQIKQNAWQLSDDNQKNLTFYPFIDWLIANQISSVHHPTYPSTVYNQTD
jgi:hypothetical protein